MSLASAKKGTKSAVYLAKVCHMLSSPARAERTHRILRGIDGFVQL